MGLFEQDVTILNPEKPQQKLEVQLLVDTGAVMSVIPADALKAIGIEPFPISVDLEVMDSRRVSRRLGYALFEVKGKEAIRPVIFGESGDQPILGADVLQAIGLWVDSKKERLVVPSLEE